jgi:hypothetical protein
VDIDAAVNNPVTVKLPEILTSLPIPTPPTTTSAPLLNNVLFVVLLIVCMPANVFDPVVAIVAIPVVLRTSIWLLADISVGLLTILAKSTPPAKFAYDELIAYDAVVANEAVGGINVMLVAAEEVVAKDAVAGVNVIDVAALAVVANEAVGGVKVMDVAALAVIACDALLINPTYDPLNDPLWIPTNEPVNEPVLICWELLTVPAGNPAGKTYDEVTANDAVDGVNVILVAADAVVANEDVVANDEVAGIKVIDVAADAVLAKEAVDGTNVMDVAALAVIANDAEVTSPLNEPVNDPVLICWELETVPWGKPDGITYDAVVANEAVCGTNVIDVAALAVVANEAVDGINVIDVAALAVVANDAVVIEPLNEPVLICCELDTNVGLLVI